MNEQTPVTNAPLLRIPRSSQGREMPLRRELVAFRHKFELDGYATLLKPPPSHQEGDEPTREAEGINLAQMLSAAAGDWIEKLTLAGRQAPPDRNPGSLGARRFRNYHWGIYVGRCSRGSRFTAVEPYFDPAEDIWYTTYLQLEGLNRDSSAERRFEPFPKPLLAHPGLQEFVDLLFQTIPGRLFPNFGRDPLKLGLHLIKLHPEGPHPGFSSPNVAHVDGERVTFIILLERHNIMGGENLIVDRSFADTHPNEIPDHALISEITLMAPLDIAVVDDARVAHYVFPVNACSSTEGWRTVLLIDFTPLKPVLSGDPVSR